MDHRVVRWMSKCFANPEKAQSKWTFVWLSLFRWVLPKTSWSVCWRYSATRLMSMSLVSPPARRLFGVLESRIPQEETWLKTCYKWVEPFVLTISRFARPEHLEWAWKCGMNFRRRTSSGSSFLYELVSSENISGLKWAIEKKMEINDTGPNHLPLLSYILMHKSPGHVAMEMMIQAGASWDFASPIGVSAQHTLQDYPQWQSWCEEWKRNRDDRLWREQTYSSLLDLSDEKENRSEKTPLQVSKRKM